MGVDVWLVLGFAGMGLLIGNLVGLTSEKIVMPVIGLLFAFIGSSILAFLHKLSEHDRNVAGKAILSLSVCCLLGVYVSVFVAERQLLSPAPSTPSVSTTATAPQSSAPAGPIQNKYLNSEVITAAEAIDSQKQLGRLNAEEAYEQMYRLVRQTPASPASGEQR